MPSTAPSRPSCSASKAGGHRRTAISRKPTGTRKAAPARDPEPAVTGLETYLLPTGGLTPNSRLPLVVRRAALEPDPEDAAGAFEAVFRANGWTGGWRNGIFGYEHFHTTAHEVLGIAAGSAVVRFGGERGRELPLATGDVVVIPAGIGHKLIEEEGRLLVVGAYAGGRSWDIVRPSPSKLEAALERIAAVPLPEADPVAGADGPLLRLWGVGPA